MRRSRILRVFLLAVLCGFWWALVAKGAEPKQRAEVVILTPALLERVVSLSLGWRYHPGDDLRWAESALDDSAWPLAEPALDRKEPPGGWRGIGWFRRKVRLGEGVGGEGVGIHMLQAGASEVYLDGELVLRFGVVSEKESEERAVTLQTIDTLTLRRGVDHVIAVRFSNARGSVLSGGMRGFRMTLGDTRALTATGIRLYTQTIGLLSGATGLVLAFTLLHVLLFLFNPRLRENLYFALFTAAMAGALGAEVALSGTSDLEAIRRGLCVTFTLVVAMVISGLLLEHRVFRRRLDPLFWIVSAAGAVALGWLWTRPALSSPAPMHLFIVAGVVAMLRLALGAILRREPEAWVIGAGFCLLTVNFFVTALRNLGFVDVSPWPMFVISGGSLVLSFSVYLTRQVARTNRELERRLREVEELTELTLAQERAAREQELTRHLLEADNRRKTEELEEARRLQLAMLPQKLPDLGTFEVAVRMTIANEVGGDYYDFHRGADGRWTVAVGDATGHGFYAGMVVGVVKSLFQTRGGGPSLSCVLAEIDAGLASMRARRVSMGLLLLRLDGSTLRVASAGIPPLLVWRQATGTVEEILIPAPPLGTMSGVQRNEVALPVYPGDMFLIATDGLPEGLNPSGEPFGYERMGASFAAAASLSPADAITRLSADAELFRAGAPLMDDVTLLVLRASALAP